MLTKAEMSASVASIVDFGLAIGLYHADIFNYGTANMIGVVCGGITNCCINYRYVFHDTNRSKKGVAWRYFMVWFASMIFNGFGTNVITTVVGARFFIIIKSIIAFLVAVLFNYPLQRKFVFKTE